MLKVLNIFFVTLGVIFVAILIYLFAFSPINPSMFFNFDKISTSTQVGTSTTTDKNPLLTSSQEKTLESFGINPASLPSKITPEMEACFISKLGTVRVKEIKAGSAPTASEFYTARSCI